MLKHLVLFEDFKPEDTDPYDAWDIPTSVNSGIRSVVFEYPQTGETVEVIKDDKMVMPGLINDASDVDHENGGFQYRLNRHWLDVSLGNSLVNYIEKNVRDFTRPSRILVTIRPEGVNKNIQLEYELYNHEYRLVSDKRLLSLD